MKIRNGFVSNSSSSSFVICKKNLTQEQITKIKQWLNNITNEDNDIYCEDTYFSETKKHFFGRISYHTDLEFFHSNNIEIECGD